MLEASGDLFLWSGIWYLRMSLLGNFSNSHTFNQRLKYAWEFVIHSLGKNVNYFHDEKASTV